VKVARRVLRGLRGSNAPGLPDRGPDQTTAPRLDPKSPILGHPQRAVLPHGPIVRGQAVDLDSPTPHVDLS
jgi:hypothetical protein